MVSLHTSLDVDYEEIFRRYVKGDLDGYRISRKDNDKCSTPSLKDTLLEIARSGETHGYDYVRVCEMHMSGMSVQDICKEVRAAIYRNMFPEEDSVPKDTSMDEADKNLDISVT